MLEEYITEKEAAKMLGVSVKAVQNWRSKNRNLSFAKMGKNIRYLKKNVKDFAAKQLVPSITEVAIKRRSTVINVAKMPVEQLLELSIERLVELEKEAVDASREATGIKNCISGVIAIRNSMNNASNDNQQIVYGGKNAQTTNY